MGKDLVFPDAPEQSDVEYHEVIERMKWQPGSYNSVHWALNWQVHGHKCTLVYGARRNAKSDDMITPILLVKLADSPLISLCP